VTVTRFAPSPNGSLHLGHAYSAIVGHDLAKAGGGRFLFRIEDIDGPRSRPELAAEFRADLAWLGLRFDEVAAQSSRLDSYAAAAERLRALGLLYPCTCTRSQVEALAPRLGAEGPVYAGTCKGRRVDPSLPAAWRIDVEAALALTGPLPWEDEDHGMQVADSGSLREFGDVVLVRKDAPASYHLASTLDDAADGVTLVTRGMDLFGATHVQRLLQGLLDLPVPRWHHHPLLVDEAGQKLAKRRGSPSLADRRAGGENGIALARDLRARRFPSGIRLAST
jgi:glutamyl-Q tRNA(Asp) synthetase